MGPSVLCNSVKKETHKIQFNAHPVSQCGQMSSALCLCIVRLKKCCSL